MYVGLTRVGYVKCSKVMVVEVVGSVARMAVGELLDVWTLLFEWSVAHQP